MQDGSAAMPMRCLGGRAKGSRVGIVSSLTLLTIKRSVNVHWRRRQQRGGTRCMESEEIQHAQATDAELEVLRACCGGSD